jgi:hypothetical protein
MVSVFKQAKKTTVIAAQLQKRYKNDSCNDFLVIIRVKALTINRFWHIMIIAKCVKEVMKTQ